MKLENIIISNLLHNETFSRKSLPYIKPEYFPTKSNKVIFQLIDYHVTKYTAMPTKESLLIDLEKIPNIQEEMYKEIVSTISSLSKEPIDDDWLLENTEKWCLDRSVHNAIMKAISIYDGKDTATIESLPTLLADAISVNFDSNLGHNYLENFEQRWEYYNNKQTKIPFHLEYLDRITNGGLSLKTLTCILAGIHVGKSLIMCSMAAMDLINGYDVVYFTLELSEEVVSQRIDAHLMNVPLNDILKMSKDEYLAKSEKVRARCLGKLIIKEYPTAAASVTHFRHFLQELKIKKKFKAKKLYVDYLNLCNSSRVKAGVGANSYTIIKAIAEELRGLGIEENLPVVTATQLTRQGLGASDVDMTDVSECLALDTKVIKNNGDHVDISTLKVNDKILGSNGFVTVIKVHCPKKKKLYIIKTKSGKIIKCSSEHVFPTNIGRVCVNTGLQIGVKLKKI